MFTPEELEYIKETLGEDWYRKAQELSLEAQEGRRVREELKENLEKIFRKPEAKRHFINALKSAEIPVDIPVDPYEESINEVKKEVSKIKNNVELSEQRKKVEDLLQRYNITPEEYDALIAFQKEYKIADNERAIELYAIYRDMKRAELPPTRPFKVDFSSELSEEEVYKKTIEELNKIARGGR